MNLLPNNEHKVERGLRVVLGLGLMSLTVLGPQTMWGALGAILVVTGVVGTCPIYALTGINTNRG